MEIMMEEPPVPVNPLSPERDVSFDHLPYDERPAQAQGMMNAFINTPERFKNSPTRENADEVGDSKTPMKVPLQPAIAQAMSEAGSRPGEPELESLTGSDEKNASYLFGFLGEEPARCIFSKHWQLREKGLAETIDVITSNGIEGDVKEGFRLISHYILAKTLKDKVAHIIQSSVDCLRELLTNYGDQVGGKEVQHSMSELVPILIDRVGESNGIIRDRAFEAILMLSDLPEVGNGGVLAASLVKPIKRQSQWKPILSRLSLMNELLPKFGLSQHKAVKGDHSHGFTVHSVMNFVNPAFSSANEDVRKSAISVSRIVMDTIGEQALERLLPGDLNPFLKDAILGDLAPSQSPAMVKRSPAPPKPKATPKPKSVPRASNKPASVKKTQEAKSKPPAAVKQDKENVLPEEAEPEVHLSPVEALEQEIANREAKFGPDHVEVGHALVDLAVLLSEEGRPDDSVPLYERALNVYEEAEGSESSNVAQTLTDLAVIHIEAGRDDIGKPQLERAQSILEAELGPDHEDVQAIRDVLDNLDEPQEEEG
jgi:centrosomal protein CEP104